MFIRREERFLDCIILLPLLFIPWDWIVFTSRPTYMEFFVALSYMMRIMKGDKVISTYFSWAIGETEVSKQMFTIVLTLLQLVYISAGMLMILENFSAENEDRLSFHIGIYSIVCTLSTLGYGDVNANTDAGKVLIMFLILITIILIPNQTSELLRLISMQSVYARKIYKSNSEVPFIVVTG